MSTMRPIITLGQPHVAGTIDLFWVECLALRAQKREGSPHVSEPLLPSLALREWGLYALRWLAPQD